MNSFALRRYAFSISAAAALLAGCGGSEPPIGAPEPLVRRATSNYQVIYNFQGGNDGVFPASWAAPLAVLNNELYGTTEGGGGSSCRLQGGCGTVFKTSTSGSESVIYSFQAPNDGSIPDGPVVRFDRAWYGTTNQGGANGYGAIFAINASGRERIIHSFGGGSRDGAYPFGQLFAFRHVLYGTTSAGGSAALGTVYKLKPSGGVQILHSFTSNGDGASPRAGLIALDGMLYGTTMLGGDSLCIREYPGCGTVYSISTSGVEKVIYKFKGGRDGAIPQAPLTAIAHNLYGTTWIGGGQGYLGTAFKLSLSGKVRVLHRFSEYGVDGYNPDSALFDLNGTLYGTTSIGGKSGDGVVFSLTTSGTESILHAFGPTPDGDSPNGVTAIGNTLYGTTSAGGTGRCYYPTGCGTIFSLTL
jgi:uncharacterized repeat protein (TIGR03803 family)